jgi:hypothetical protein
LDGSLRLGSQAFSCGRLADSEAGLGPWFGNQGLTWGPKRESIVSSHTMPRKILQLEERIVAQSKRLRMTIDEVKKTIDDEDGNLRSEIKVRQKGVRVRLVIRAKSPNFTAWAMALIVNNDRVDGIDWENRFLDLTGAWKSGFHRHVWAPKLRTCKGHKRHLPEFTPSTLEGFIVDGLGMLNVVLKKGGTGDDDGKLQFH